MFKNESLASPFENKKIVENELTKTEKAKVEAASLILELNEQALASFAKDDIEKAFLNFKKC